LARLKIDNDRCAVVRIATHFAAARSISACDVPTIRHTLKEQLGRTIANTLEWLEPEQLALTSNEQLFIKVLVTRNQKRSDWVLRILLIKVTALLDLHCAPPRNSPEVLADYSG